MLLPRDELSSAYDFIKEDAIKGGCTVLILVAPEPDALASLRLFTYLLRIDNIPFTAKAVANYDDVMKCREQLEGGEIKSVVMINCGAVVDVRDVLGLSFDQTIRCFILDSHRPVHLANLHAPVDNVIVFDDGLVGATDYPSDGDDLSDDSDSDSESEIAESEVEESDVEAEFDDELGRDKTEEEGDGGDVNDEENGEEEEKEEELDKESEVHSEMEDEEEEGAKEEEEEEEGEEREHRKRKAGEDSDADSDLDDDMSQSSGGFEDRRKKRSNLRKSSGVSQGLTDRRDRRNRVKSYYEANYHGLPSSFIMFDLCSTLSRAEADQVWLACLGITDFYVHEKMTEKVYIDLHNYMESHILRLGRDDQTNSSEDTMVPVAETGNLFADEELRFMHFRHWSLYDSMYFSPYVSSRLCVWKAHGKAKLHELFAKLGVSLEHCKQKWSFLPQLTKSNVLQQINEHSSQFDLTDLNYPAFQRCVGFSSRVSASDVVHAVTALLEAKSGSGGGNARGSAPQAAIDGTTPIKDTDQSEWLSSFWAAYDTLLVKDSKVLERGIDLSMRQQREIHSRAVAIIEKRSFVTLKHFRYAYLTKSTGFGLTDDMFTQPIALTNLARFLVEIHRQNNKWTGSKQKPLLLLAEKTNTYLVVGVACKDVPGDGTTSFGKAFKHALEHCHATSHATTFDNAVLEIKRDDVHRFIESLLFIMS